MKGIVFGLKEKKIKIKRVWFVKFLKVFWVWVLKTIFPKLKLISVLVGPIFEKKYCQWGPRKKIHLVN